MDWVFPTPLVRATFFTKSADSNVNLFWRHHHRYPSKTIFYWPSGDPLPWSSRHIKLTTQLFTALNWSHSLQTFAKTVAICRPPWVRYKQKTWQQRVCLLALTYNFSTSSHWNSVTQVFCPYNGDNVWGLTYSDVMGFKMLSGMWDQEEENGQRNTQSIPVAEFLTSKTVFV